MESEHGLLRRMLASWDISLRPHTNDRTAKLGSGFLTRYAVIGNTDLSRKTVSLVDALSDLAEDVEDKTLALPEFASMAIEEPDNSVLRVHFNLSAKVSEPSADIVKALRLIADNTNPDSSIKNRGTHVIDQEDSQAWGILNDFLQVTDRTASVDGPELGINDAGVLGLLYPAQEQAAALAHHQLALKIHANQGLVTDGSYLGALGHVVGFKGGGGGGGTVAGGRGGGRPSKADDLLLLAEAGYLYQDGKTVSLPVIEPGSPTLEDDGTDEYAVHFYQGQKLGNGIKVATDGKSNFSSIKRKSHTAIAGYIKIPKVVQPYQPVKPKHQYC